MTDKTLVRGVEWPESPSTPLATPLQMSTAYVSVSPDALDAQYDSGEGFTYAREGHPNATVLAQKIDMLEGISGGIITSSGMSAASAMFLGLLKSGDHIVGGDQLYGRTMRLMTQELPRFGITATLADPTDAVKIEAAIQPNTKLIVLEVLSNPTLRMADFHAIVALAKRRNILLAIDNTFTTPRAFRPFDHGADIVFHSVTKLLAGHSDATLGYVVARDPALQRAIYEANVTWGLTPSPFDCWLAERGLHSFELRFDKAQSNAAILADTLAELPNVARVIYPGRADFEGYISLFNGRFGNMVSFELAGGREAANAFTKAAAKIAFAPTLGDISTTLSHPASSSHRALTPDARAKLGMSEGFFRVSVGIEDPEFLVQQFGDALRSI